MRHLHGITRTLMGLFAMLLFTTEGYSLINEFSYSFLIWRHRGTL
jgi:hypothetical protein